MHFEIYPGRGKEKGQYRWRLVADNGKIIANSGEAFHNRKDCQGSIFLIRADAATAPINEVIEPKPKKKAARATCSHGVRYPHECKECIYDSQGFTVQ